MNHQAVNARQIKILLVEDSAGDVRLTQEALRDSKLCNRLHVVNDGVAALAFLRQQPPYQDAPRPDVILLDLNLPKKGGHEVLAEVKSDPALRRIPIIILTTSSAEEDILKTYDLHANCYITKPLDFSKFAEIVHHIEDFWFSIVRLPPS